MITNKVDAKCSAGNLVSLLKMFLLQFKSHKPRMSFQVAEKFIESISHFFCWQMDCGNRLMCVSDCQLKVFVLIEVLK